MSASNKDLIERFCDTLWLQDGLSANTLEAYRRDLEGLERWFSKRGTALASASRADLQEHLSQRVSKKAHARLRGCCRACGGFTDIWCAKKKLKPIPRR